MHHRPYPILLPVAGPCFFSGKRSAAFFGARKVGVLQKRGEAKLGVAPVKSRWFALHAGSLQFYDKAPQLPRARLALGLLGLLAQVVRGLGRRSFEPVEIHDLGPGRDEVGDEGIRALFAGVDLRNRSQR